MFNQKRYNNQRTPEKHCFNNSKINTPNRLEKSYELNRNYTPEKSRKNFIKKKEIYNNQRKFSPNNNSFLENKVKTAKNLEKQILEKSVNYSPSKKKIYKNENTIVKKDIKFLLKVLKKIAIFEKEAEKVKQDISLRPDFNLLDFFRIFDKEQNGFSSLEEFEITLKELKIFPKNNELFLLLSKFDTEKLGYIRLFYII